MKYIDADKLRAEIERQKHYSDNCIGDKYYYGWRVVCERLLAFLDTIEAEQPSLPEGLEEAAEKTYPLIPKSEISNTFQELSNSYMLCRQEGFKAGAEWQKKKDTRLEKAKGWFHSVNQGGQAILIDIFPELAEGLDPRYKSEEKDVDLEKEIARFALNGGTGDNTPTIGEVAHHFYSLGLNAGKEDEK